MDYFRENGYSVYSLQRYLELGGDINIKGDDRDKWTLLFYVAMRDDKDAFDFLIENGIDINMKDYDDDTVLSQIIACPDYISNHIYFIKKLLEKGIIVDSSIKECIERGWYAESFCYNIIKKHLEDLEELEIKHIVDDF